VRFNALSVSDGDFNHRSGSGRLGLGDGSRHLRATWRQAKRDRFLYALVALPLLYFVIFRYLPMIGVIVAFKDYDPYQGMAGILSLENFVGFQHFQAFLRSVFFWNVLGNTVWLGFLKLVWGFPAPLILALLLNEVRHAAFKRTVQTVSYLPHFFSAVVVAGIVRAMLSSQGGLVNQLVVALGGQSAAPLTDPALFRTILVITSIWQHAGWSSIIYLAALTTISPELYEAATVDGAGRLQRLWHITLPGIAFAIVINLILAFGGLLHSDFEQILLLYSPAVYGVADVIDTFVYRSGLIGRQYSYAAAVGLCKSLAALGLLLIANRAAHRAGQPGLW
jgi:putative aldouronate transport system permease protein